MKKTTLSVLLSTALGAGVSPATLVAYYSFEGQNAEDQSAVGNDGVAAGGVSYTSGDIHANLSSSTYAAYFDGQDGTRIQAPSSSETEFASGRMTLSFWMKSDTATENANWVRSLSKGTGNSGFDIQRVDANSNGRVRVATDNNNNQESDIGGSIWDNSWHHVVVILDNGSVTTYRDGANILTDTYNQGTNDFTTSHPFVMGDTDRENGREFTGWLDDVAMWDAVLTEEQVVSLYNGASPLSIVPEPASVGLALLGLLGFLRRRRV
ncbi:MAG: LamG domain-containing protein [Verrucomicrobiales bacterium]